MNIQKPSQREKSDSKTRIQIGTKEETNDHQTNMPTEIDIDEQSEAFITENKENKNEIVTSTPISIDNEQDNTKSVVSRKKYKSRHSQISYITHTPSSTMTMADLSEANSLKRVPSDIEWNSASTSYSELEGQLRSYMKKENEWVFERKAMKQEIHALNEELDRVKTELQRFMDFGFITNYTNDRN